MSKELTEQWRNGTLEGGIYYLLLRDGTTVTDKTVYIVGEKQLRWHYSSFDFVKEVLAPVPDYDKFSQLVKKVHILNEAAMNMENAIASNADYFRQKISVLESRINKAVALIKEGRFVEALKVLED